MGDFADVDVGSVKISWTLDVVWTG